MDYGLITVLGLVIGSFLNVCIYRIPVEESIAFPPSHCGKCQHNLSPVDLVPVFSYIFLGGRCKYCKEKISLRYPLIEILNALLYLIIYLKFGLVLITLKYCILASLLIVIGMIDYDTQFVFTSTTILGGIIAVTFIIIQAIIYKSGTIDFISGGAIGFGIIGLIVFLTKGMGEGDIEIATVCGLFLGVKGILLGLFLAIILGGIVGIIILALKLKKAKEKIAFGPCIAIGSLISMLWGVEILKLYWNLLV
ncbi:prepilin peptidase [Clostridium gelidum]|uniref:Prepilin peptidase n=1 Tax=Clostridium gelidum TaxID=704125 RepID=A0ABN6IUE5_9CLOT|nr:A24 family peptidase [Clostridium gelidum]BCZ45236.1 prepilin peptidase [Clostridium gelidum]